MPIRIIHHFDTGHIGELLGVELFADPFSDDRHPMFAAHHPPLQHRPFENQADVGETDALLRKLLRNDGQGGASRLRSEEHTSELQSLAYLVCRLLLEKKNS